MSEIGISNGFETIITRLFHLRFLWMGDHWKQEIVSTGDCQAIPRIWSIEGRISHNGRLEPSSPVYQRIHIEQEQPGVTVAKLIGQLGPRHYSGVFIVTEHPEEVVVEIEIHCRGEEPNETQIATYLIESSGGHIDLDGDEAATITWPNPETHLVFEAEPPARIEANEAGMGTIRFRVLAEPDPNADISTLRYRWRWIPEPGHQIWDREV